MMTLIVEQRSSDSPYIEAVMHGRTLGAGDTIRPAESRWHMVFTRFHGRVHPIFVGPLTSAGSVQWGEGAEILWIKFKLSVFMRPLPPRDFLDAETPLPEAGSQSFWLDGSAWQYPDFENVETFVARLVREDVLDQDPVVEAVLQGRRTEAASRTVRHRFLRATGLTHTQIVQLERAQRASALLQQGRSILDTVFELGYFDQPHLTRALKRLIGHTPAQVQRLAEFE